MDRRFAVVATAGAFAVLLVLVTANGSPPAPSLPAESAVSPQPTSVPSTTDQQDAVSAVDPEADAVSVVLEYWDSLTDGCGDVAALLDMGPIAVEREVALAEYSVALGGTYQATCRQGVTVGDETVVDCDVEVVDEPLAAAFDIGSNPTQFRVRDRRITRVGYLKAYSTIDLALSAFALRTDADGFDAACSDPSGRYIGDAGVVYNGQCGEFLARLVAAAIAELEVTFPCGPECDAALLSAIRPSRD